MRKRSQFGMVAALACALMLLVPGAAGAHDTRGFGDVTAETPLTIDMGWPAAPVLNPFFPAGDTGFGDITAITDYHAPFGPVVFYPFRSPFGDVSIINLDPSYIIGVYSPPGGAFGDVVCVGSAGVPDGCGGTPTATSGNSGVSELPTLEERAAEVSNRSTSVRHTRTLCRRSGICDSARQLRAPSVEPEGCGLGMGFCPGDRDSLHFELTRLHNETDSNGTQGNWSWVY